MALGKSARGQNHLISLSERDVIGQHKDIFMCYCGLTCRCVGESFAYTQLSTIMSYIVRNYTMKLETPHGKFPATNYRVSPA